MLEASLLVVAGLGVLGPVVSLAAAALFARVLHAGRAWAFGVPLVWLGLTAVLALRGVFTDWARRPPPLVLAVGVAVVGVALLARSSLGLRVATQTPLWALVGLQAFRLPLEWVMHHAANEGVMPLQMTYTGWNFDIVTGATALLLGAVLTRRPLPRAVLLGWNVLGTTLLLAIMTIAVLSTPVAAAFGPEPERLNTWIGYFPAVWLPLALVPTALLGHLLLWRRLLSEEGRRSPSAGAARPPPAA